ncbi:MAG: DUF2206 domain-containing protein [Chloroflexota bacterium]|nr:DUF2206 domain-containing protein [Chloroflexota bacterium]
MPRASIPEPKDSGAGQQPESTKKGRLKSRLQDDKAARKQHNVTQNGSLKSRIQDDRAVTKQVMQAQEGQSIKSKQDYKIVLRQQDQVAQDTMISAQHPEIFKFSLFVIVFLISTDLAILLDIPVWRQVMGFLFFTVVPGILLLHVLKLNHPSLTEKLVMSVGLSISILMFGGLLLNWVYFGLGYDTPLSTTSLILSFSILVIILVIIGYKRNKQPIISLKSFRLDSKEKAFLILPAIFPLLSILGMHIMNLTDSNSIIIALLLLIPTYTIFITIMNHRVPNRVYPPTIFFMSFSLLMLLALRSSHIIGADSHSEYYLFQLTSHEEHWRMFTTSSLQACLSISLLPAIYQSFLDINPEYLFKTLYPFLLSIAPLVIYILSRKYIGNSNAFIASLFFMSQTTFLWTTANARTNLAVLFFGLAIMVIFRKGIDNLSRRLLFIAFAASCIFSHYSTTYIFLFTVLFTAIGTQVLAEFIQRRRRISIAPSQPAKPIEINTPTNPEPNLVPMKGSTIGHQDLPLSSSGSRLKQTITMASVTLFFAMVFFWYVQAIGTPVNSLEVFIHQALTDLDEFFVVESRGDSVTIAAGEGVGQKEIPRQIEFVFSWLTIALIAIGMLAVLVQYKNTVAFQGITARKLDYLKAKLHTEYFMMCLACCLILVISVSFPHLLKGYAMDRTFFQMMVILSPLFVIGGITLSNLLRLPHYWIALIILIPFFMCATGIMAQFFDYPKAVTLNSEGHVYDYIYIHDEETFAAYWLKDHVIGNHVVYSDHSGGNRLSNQHNAYTAGYARFLFEDNPTHIGDYFFLRRTNVVEGRLMDRNYQWHDIGEYMDIFSDNNRIYSNNGSEVFMTS